MKKHIIFDDTIRLRAQPINSLIYQLKTCYKLFKTSNNLQFKQNFQKKMKIIFNILMNIFIKSMVEVRV